jgi:hypothetical protein
MADKDLRELERKVLAGDAPIEQLWAAQCRTDGHQWTNLIGFPFEVLYLHLCSRCLATRGKKRDQFQLPEFFTVADDKRNHIISMADNASKFRAVCGRKFKTSEYHSPEMIAEVKEFFKNCHNAPTCKQCINLCKQANSNHGIFARRRVWAVYRSLFRPLAFVMEDF